MNWNFDSGDTSGKSASDSIAAYKKLSYPNSHIALNHEVRRPSPLLLFASSTLDRLALFPHDLTSRRRTCLQTYKTTTDTVIPAVVPALKAKGYKLVSMAECLGQSAYQSTGTPGKRDSTWTCSGTPAPGKT